MAEVGVLVVLQFPLDELVEGLMQERLMLGIHILHPLQERHRRRPVEESTREPE